MACFTDPIFFPRPDEACFQMLAELQLSLADLQRGVSNEAFRVEGSRA